MKPPNHLILEGIVTTLSDDASVNISPMGPEVESPMTHLVLKPYQSSTTYRNLQRTGQGVFHVTDDVELLAHAAVGMPDPLPKMRSATSVAGRVLIDACRSYEFVVESIDDSQPRTVIVARVVDTCRLRDFFGFNRAKHAVVEAAILATRVHLLAPEEILAQIEPLRILVQKTGGLTEARAFDFLDNYICKAVAARPK